jgi:hypothetical protein
MIRKVSTTVSPTLPRLTGGNTWTGMQDITGATRFEGMMTFRIGTEFTFDTGVATFLRNAISLSQTGTAQFANLTLSPSASLTPASNGNLVIEATSNTQLTFKLKGSDGTVRSGTITLS